MGFADAFDDVGLLQAAGELEAGDAGLGDLKGERHGTAGSFGCGADLPDIADADFRIGQSGDGEILAKKDPGPISGALSSFCQMGKWEAS